MEVLMALVVGVLVGCGIYLILRPRMLSVVFGLVLLSYGTNLLVFSMGRLTVDAPPLIGAGTAPRADPLPQALVLTAIVIGFAMTAFLLALALRAYGDRGSDHVDDSSSEA